jgi:phosphatidylglycerophosphate synthase
MAVVHDMTDDRRPIASRNAAWATRTAAWLAARGVRPNRISQASIACAAIAALLLAAAGDGPAGAAALLGTAAAIQGRLLCNLLDGMVAVEGGLREPDGPFWNEFPDRIADLLILGGAGLAAANPALGLAAASLALLTAYTRALGRACGAPSDFGGPMAKQHRMATLTAACLIAALTPLGAAPAMTVALWIIIAGSALTTLLRAGRMLRHLTSR